MTASFKRFLTDNQVVLHEGIDQARANQNTTPLAAKPHRKPGQISKRQSALIDCRVAGYHDDTRKFIRAYTENRITYTSAQEEWKKGVRMKQAGVLCTCFLCKQL